jgi:uncharacterized membrane protein
MNDFTRFLLLNIGKAGGALLGLAVAVMILSLGLSKTLFIFLFTALGFLLGKFVDEGGSLKKSLKDIFNSLRVDKWH